jgi:uncharacterized protein
MRLIDVNLLLYAENADSPINTRAKGWWEATLSSGEPVYIAWLTIIAYLRLTTNRNSMPHPWSSDQAADRLDTLLAHASVRIAAPGGRHWEIYAGLVRKYKLTGNSLTDAHLVALAVEYNLEVNSADSGFSRYSEITYKNPVA